MKKDHTQEAALHLRRIHFFILLSSIACLVLLFGYRNHSVQMGLDELKILTDELKPILQVKEKESFSALSNKWDELRVDISFHKYWVLTSEKIIEITKEDAKLPYSELLHPELPHLELPHPELPHPETQTVDTLSLDSCKNWDNIYRTDSSEFSTQLQRQQFYLTQLLYLTQLQRQQFYLSNCSWLGENTLFYAQLSFDSNSKAFIFTPDSQADSQEKNKYIMPLNESGNLRSVSSASNLDDCGRWSKVERNDYLEFTQKLSNLDVPFYCYWQDEDKLVVFNGKAKSEDVVLVTPEEVTSWDKVTLDSFKELANRVEDSEIEKCEGTHVDDSIEKIRSDFKKTTPNKGALFCYWINSNHLIVMKILWDKSLLPGIDIQNYRDRVGLSFDEAFPGLTSLRELQELYPEESDSISNILSKLKKELLDIDATIAGISVKQEVLLFGGPPLLVLLQLYFLLHYANFVVLCDRTRRTIFPWIGMYKDRPSKFVFCVSLCIVPPFAMFLFANEQVAQNDLIAWTVFAVSAIISLLQLYFIIQFWLEKDETVFDFFRAQLARNFNRFRRSNWFLAITRLLKAQATNRR